MLKGRIAYLDLVRLLACIMVIIMHAPMPDIGTPSFVLTGLSFITAPCIGLFFMVSGALLLSESYSMFEFYKRRLSKIIIPTIVWTIVYLSVALIEGSISVNKLPYLLFSIPFSAQGYGILWFMYVLVGLYLMTPIISPWLKSVSKKEIEFVLGLWIISLMYPILSNAVSVNDSNSGVLYYFSGYAGYYLLGYYLNKYNPHFGVLTSFLLIVFPIIVCGLSIRLINYLDFYRYFWYLSIFVVSMAIGWFNLMYKLNVKENKFLAMISTLSFGVYLSHILIMRSLIWKMCAYLDIRWYIQILLTVIVSFILSLLVSLFLAKLPFGKYIVGYQYMH